MQAWGPLATDTSPSETEPAPGPQSAPLLAPALCWASMHPQTQPGVDAHPRTGTRGLCSCLGGGTSASVGVVLAGLSRWPPAPPARTRGLLPVWNSPAALRRPPRQFNWEALWRARSASAFSITEIKP